MARSREDILSQFWTRDEVEEFFKVYEAKIKRFKQKLMMIEFAPELSGLSEAAKGAISATVRETLIEIVETPLPDYLKEALGEDFARRFDEIKKHLLPDKEV